MSKRREVGSSNPPSYIDTTLPPQFNLALIRQHSRHRIETNNRLLFQSAYGKSRSLFDNGAVIETAGADVIDRHGPGGSIYRACASSILSHKNRRDDNQATQRTVGKGNDKFWKSMEDVQARTTPGLLKPVNNLCDVEVERQLLRRPVGKNKNINSLLNLYLDTFGQQPYGKDLEISWVIEQVYRQKELYEERREDNDRIVHQGRIDMTDSDIHSWGNRHSTWTLPASSRIPLCSGCRAASC